MTAIKLSSSPQFAVCEGINYWPVLGSPNLTLVFFKPKCLLGDHPFSKEGTIKEQFDFS